MTKKENTIKSIYSSLKMIWHPEKMKDLREGVVSAPINVRIKPTNKCDHNCFYCSYHPDADIPNILSKTFNKNDEIPKEKMREILDDFKAMGVKGNVYSGGGEPLLYQGIHEILRETIEAGIDLGIITNGQHLYGKNAEALKDSNWVRISLDTYKPKTFSKSRGVSQKLFSKLEENITEFARIKNPKCAFGINFVVHHLNQDEIYDAVRYFKKHGLNNVKFTPRWIDKKGEWLKYHEPFKNKVIEQIKHAKKDFTGGGFAIKDTYENDFTLTGIPERTYSWCPTMQIIPVIAADCNVYFCHDKTYTGISGILGSIKDKSFKDLWFSREAKEKFKTFNPKKECQQHCTYDSRNILIIDAINSYNKRHINFP